MREKKRRNLKRVHVIALTIVMIVTLSSIIYAGVTSVPTYIEDADTQFAKITNYINIDDTTLFGKVYSSVEGNYDGSCYSELGNGSKWKTIVKVEFYKNAILQASSTYTSPSFSGTSTVYVWGGYYKGYGLGSNRTTNSIFYYDYSTAQLTQNKTTVTYYEYNPDGSLATELKKTTSAYCR